MQAFLNLIRNSGRYTTEGVLTPIAAWVALVLWLPPSNFARYPAAYHLVERLQADEQFWALAMGLAFALHAAGLIGLLCAPCRLVSVSLRIAGLAISSVFWLVLAVSFIAGDHASIGAAMAFALSLMGLLEILRGPPLPRPFRGRRETGHGR